MSLRALADNTVTVEDEDWADATSTMLEKWLEMYGVHPGYSSPRGGIAVNPLCGAETSWFWSL